MNIGNKRFLIRIAVVCAVMICAVVGFYLYGSYMKQSSVRHAQRELKTKVEGYSDLAYEDKTIENTDLSGKTASEISSLLNSHIQAVANRKLNITIDTDTYEYSADDLQEKLYFLTSNNKKYEADESEELASYIISLDKELSVEDQAAIIDGKRSPTPLTVNIISSASDVAIKKIISEYQKIYDISPKNATINSKLKVKKEKEGQVLDTSAIASDIKSYINSVSTEDFDRTYTTDEVHPEVYASYLKKIKKNIGSYSTTFIPDNARGKNIKIAAKRLNGTLLNPDDEISFLEKLYDDSDGEKYEESGGFLGTKVVQVEGGGICQVSTTAYDAFLKAGIIPIERHPHTCPVSYAPMGLDAALAIGTKDLVIKNTYDVPVFICARIKGMTLTVDIYSYKKAKQGYSYKPRAVKINGELSAKSYLDIYREGTMVDSIALSTDTYKKAGA